MLRVSLSCAFLVYTPYHIRFDCFKAIAVLYYIVGLFVRYYPVTIDSKVSVGE
jgi:hypothetical protein